MNHILQLPHNSVMICGSAKNYSRNNLLKHYISRESHTLVIVDTNVGELDLTSSDALLYFDNSDQRPLYLDNYKNVIFFIDSVNIGENLVLTYKMPSTKIKNIISLIERSKTPPNCFYTAYYSSSTKNK